MRWRRRLITLHRDVGYLCAGMVLVYAISGVAVNHRHHWNYNQSVSTTTRRVGRPDKLLGGGGCTGAACLRLAREQRGPLVRRLSERLGRPAPPRKAFWRGPRRLSLFFDEAEQDVVDYDPVSGLAELTVRVDRPLLRQVNFLHLNEKPAVWTWIADLFAVALAFLALSGLLLVKGRHGLRGRGGLLLALGVAIPVAALLLLY